MEKSGGSRLLQMQARFQQKQLQEKELKIASLYEAQQARALDRVRHSPGSVAASPPPAPPPLKQPGKVRQMFEERRTKGIDKSYPLKPIQNTDRAAARKPPPNGFSKVTSTKSTTSSNIVEKKTTVKTKTTNSLQMVRRHTNQKIEKIVNGNGDVNHNHVEILSSTNNGHMTQPVMPQIESSAPSTDELDKDNNYLLENETFPEAMAPEPTPRSPERRPEKLERPPRKSPPVVAKSPSRTKPQPPPAAPPRRATPPTPPTKTVSEVIKPQRAMQRKALVQPTHSQAQPLTVSSAGSSSDSKARAAAGGAPCSVCGRRFAEDRLATHEAICKKHATKKRKPFDALKHRLAGTDAEPLIGKLRKATTSSTKAAKPLNGTWRQKHQDFIQAIRAAKQVQAHLNAGGKLSDLPPPPPSENPDYVSCPHCGRRFNQSAADRHIPKCANYQHNKPKPGAKKR